MTDITEQKQAAQVLAAKEAQLLVALENMPGALVYTDRGSSIVFCNERFREMYSAPQHCSSLVARTRSSCGFLPRTATTAKANSRASLRSAWRAYATRPAKASKTALRTAGGSASGVVGLRGVARLP